MNALQPTYLCGHSLPDGWEAWHPATNIAQCPFCRSEMQWREQVHMETVRRNRAEASGWLRRFVRWMVAK